MGNQMNTNETFPYYDEVAVVKRQDKTVFFNSHLSRATADTAKSGRKPEPPLTVFSSPSRFRVVLVAKNSSAFQKGDEGGRFAGNDPARAEILNKKTIYANIPASFVDYIAMNTNYAYTKHMDAVCSGNGGEGKPASPAYTVMVNVSKNLKQTPAELLMSNPNGVEIANRQIAFLQDNLRRYPNNQKQIDAIKEALDLYRAGKLDGTLVKKAQQVVLYRAEMRPLESETKYRGLCFIYEISIVWTIGDESPVRISILNYYAPLEKRNNGTYNVHKGNLDLGTSRGMSMDINADEWIRCVSAMQRNMLQFTVNNGNACYREQTELSKKANAEYKRKQDASSAGQGPSYGGQGYGMGSPARNYQNGQGSGYRNNLPYGGGQGQPAARNGMGNPAGNYRNGQGQPAPAGNGMGNPAGNYRNGQGQYSGQGQPAPAGNGMGNPAGNYRNGQAQYNGQGPGPSAVRQNGQNTPYSSGMTTQNGSGRFPPAGNPA